jgi:hypothetical protein
MDWYLLLVWSRHGDVALFDWKTTMISLAVGHSYVNSRWMEADVLLCGQARTTVENLRSSSCFSTRFILLRSMAGCKTNETRKTKNKRLAVVSLGRIPTVQHGRMTLAAIGNDDDDCKKATNKEVFSRLFTSF